jgi:hypothetical protein
MPSLDNSVKITVTSEADTKALQRASQDVKDLGNSNKEAAPKAGEHESKVNSLSGTVTKLATVFAGTQIISTISNFGGQLLSSAGELEQTNMSFQALIGNKAQADKLFGDLMQYANTTPFEAADVTGAAKQLLAFGETAGDTTRVVKQLGDVAAAGGGDLKAMSLVSGQVFAQGKMRAQDMYQVINDGGAGLIKIMAQNAGGMQNLTAEFDKGGIPASQYFDAINQAAGKGGFAFQGAQKQAQTFNGQMSTLKDTVTQFGLKMLGIHMDPQMGLVVEKGGLFDKIKNAIGDITKFLTELSKHKLIIEMIAGAIGGVLLGAVIAIVVAIGWIPLAIIAAAAVIGAIVAWIIDRWKEWHNWIILAGVLLFGLLAIAAIVVVEMIKHWSSIVAFFKQAWSDIKQWGNDAWQFIVGVWQAAGDWFRNTWHDITSFFSDFWGAIKGGFDRAYNNLTGWARTTVNDIVQFFKDLPGRITGAIGNISSKVAGDIKGAFHSLHIPGFATGTNFAPGGLALVGEQGPELIDLPRGSQVHTAKESAKMMSPGGATYQITIQQLVLPGVNDRKSFIAAMDADTLLAGRGLTPNLGMR